MQVVRKFLHVLTVVGLDLQVHPYIILKHYRFNSFYTVISFLSPWPTLRGTPPSIKYLVLML